jgi:hypothetical protein
MKKELGKYKEKMEQFSKAPAGEPIKANVVKDEFESPFQRRLKLLTEKRSV